MADLNAKVAQFEYDGLVSDINPSVKVGAGTIRKLGTKATLKRGTILARSSGTAGDDKLVILGTVAETNETLTADCILCDDVEVGTSADVNAAVYVCGCFDLAKCTVATSYTVSAADKKALRDAGIFFKAKNA